MGTNAEGRRTKRAAGEGTLSLVTRSNGRQVWRAGETVTLVAGTKPTRVFGEGATRAAAKDALRRNITKRQVALGQLPPTALRALVQGTGATTVEQYFRGWLGRKQVREGTRNQYETQLRLYLYPYFGSVAIATVSMEEMEAHFTGTLKTLTDPRTGKTLLGPSAYRALFKLVKSGFAAAVADGTIGVNPLARMKTPPAKRATAEERRKFTQLTRWAPQRIAATAAKHDDEARWLLALFGLRQGEALGLTWSKVSWSRKDRAKLYVEQQLVQRHKKHGCGTDARGRWLCGRQADYCPHGVGAGGWQLVEELKTAASERELALVEPLYSSLKRWKRVQDGWKKTPEWQPLPGLEDLIFTTPTGKPRRPQDDRRAWKKLLEEAGVPTHLRVHDARHFAASLMLSMPEHFTAAQIEKIGGWQNSNVLMKTYAHVGSSFTADGLRAYAAALAGNTAAKKQ